MTKQKIALLEKIGFEWHLQYRWGHKQWMDSFEELRAYKNKFGHCYVPKIYLGNGTLRKWLCNQRYQYWQLKEGKA